MKNVVVYPNAKINLGLRITGKREDGYHLIDSYFYPAKLHDILEIGYPTDGVGMQLSVSGIEIPGDLSENLLFKCYDLVKEKYPDLPSIDVHLHKQIPIGAGLGGGSSDAAFFTRELINIVGGDDIESREILRNIGSDCSYFLKNDAQHVTGVGHDMKDVGIDLNGMYALMVFPDLHISTKEAYTNCYISGEQLPKFSKSAMVESKLPNDFEISLFEKHPVLEEIKAQLINMGAVYASMSGSGSTIYGIFESKPANVVDINQANTVIFPL